MSNTILNFTLKPFVKKKVKNTSIRPANASRLCAGVVVVIDGEYRIKIYTKYDEDFDESIIIPFTEESFNLKGRKRVFSKHKDKYGHNILYIRDKNESIGKPLSSDIYTSVVEREVCTGYILRRNGALYFDLRETHGKGKYANELPVELADPKPLFKK